MIIKELALIEGMNQSQDIFSEHRNLIISETNTKGKTTFLRLLLYSLGYPIPNMKGIRFERVETKIAFQEKGIDYIVERRDAFLRVRIGQESILYTLPSDHEAFLSNVFQYDKIAVLRNLLGFLYIDQEKGWSLLNRGTVIGRIKFSIEELLSGLNNVDITGLLEKRKRLEYEKDKYSAILNIQALNEQVYEQHGELFITDIEKDYSQRISFLDLKITELKRSLREINALLEGEKQFYSFINSMQLYVSTPSGDRIAVTKETIENAPQTDAYLKARRSILVTNIEKLKGEKKRIETQLSDYELKNAPLRLFQTEDESDSIMNRKIAAFSGIDQQLVLDLLEKTTKDLAQVNKEIRELVKEQNKYISKIYSYVLDFATKLDVEKKMVQKEDYIFTKDLKSLSGAVLQKMVFAFKLAFLKVIEEAMDTKLIMIIDSPKSKELDDANTALIMKLIEEELSENQVFIASLYEFDCENIIQVNRAIEAR